MNADETKKGRSTVNCQHALFAFIGFYHLQTLKQIHPIAFVMAY